MDIHEEIKRLEEEMRNTQLNKATEYHFGLIKARIAKLRDTFERRQAAKKGGEGFFVKKSGDASVVLLGFPSVGKSTLLNKLTNAKSEVAAYEFTTLTVIPGVLEHKKAKIQILDVPGILQGAAAGRGRGKEVLAMVRSCDLILMIIDALHPEHYPTIVKEIFDCGIRLNQKKPDVKITKKMRGGIGIGATVPLSMSRETIKSILNEFKLNNADILIRSKIDIDQLIDCIEGNRSYIKGVAVLAKADLIDEKEIQRIKKEFNPKLFISAEQNKGLEELKDLIYSELGFINIYLKEVNKKADLEEPMIVRKGITLKGICERIHRDLVKKFRYARIWGKSVKFDGQIIKKLDKELMDGDVVEVHLS